MLKNELFLDGLFISLYIVSIELIISDYSATFEPHVSLELCQLFRGSCAIQFG